MYGRLLSIVGAACLLGPVAGFSIISRRSLTRSAIAMSAAEAEVADRRTPITLLSGFLGAGKTTLLKHALENKEDLRIGAVVNDLAAVNIDAKLVRDTTGDDGGATKGANADSFVELQNGCMCCTVADELFSSVAQLVSMNELRHGAGARYDHIVIESSGVSEPRAVRDNFQDAEAEDMALFDRVRLDTLVTVVDSDAFLDAYASRSILAERTDLAEAGAVVAAEEQLRMAMAYGSGGGGGVGGGQRAVVDLLVEQVECADVVVLNKADLVAPDQLDALKGVVQALNPAAAVHDCKFGELDLALTLASAGGDGAANFGIVDEHKIAVSTAKQAASGGANAAAEGGEEKTATAEEQGGEEKEEEPCGHDGHSHSSHSHEHSHGHGDHAEVAAEEGGGAAAEAVVCADPDCTDTGHSHSHEHGHSHSHDHNHGHSSTAGTRFGIGNFVYEARRPFKPSRVAQVVAALPTASSSSAVASVTSGDGDGSSSSSSSSSSSGSSSGGSVVGEAMSGLLRSKGFMWLASSPSSAFYWSHAGSHFETQLVGRWWATVDEAVIPDWQRDAIMADFQGDDGDRRQEIVFIGTGLGGDGEDEARNRATITAALDWCLLTDGEMKYYRSVQDDAVACAEAFPNPLQVRLASM